MNIDSLKILSVLPVLGHPRDSKRINMLQQAGFTVEAVAFERDHHGGRLPDCPVKRLATIADGQYLQRALSLIKVLPAMRRAIRRNHIVYTSGPDMALTALIAGLGLGRPVILEVGDIQRAQVANGPKGRLTRLLERYTASTIQLLVVTAPGFIDGYYRKWLKIRTPALVLENKLEDPEAVDEHVEVSTPLEGKPLVDRPLRIGYFGVLRCDWSWQTLQALALSRPGDLEIVVAGYMIRPADIPVSSAKIDNIKYLGEYRSPQDLEKLYGDVDLVWACYPPPETSDPNWRWAQSICRSNRFYESCFFKKPIISVSGSGDAVEVERYDIGIIITDQRTEAVAEAIGGISLGDLARWQDNLSKLPREVYVYTTETEELGGAIKGIARDSTGGSKNRRQMGKITAINSVTNTETINCPYCNKSGSTPWARENGFTAVKCYECGLVYVSPRPIQSLINEAVETGIHSNVDHGRTAVVRRVGSKVICYKKIFATMFNDVWRNQREISWLDVGAGYGEVLEAVSALAPSGSRIEGIEPMKPKATWARARGLEVSEKYLCDVTDKFDFVSLVNVYSHIPDFRVFLKEIKDVLSDNGEFYLETGNIGDLVDSHEVPTELDLPDHLVFAGEQHLKGYLSEAGFSIVEVRRMRKDGLINFAKNIIKKLIGRQVTLAIPYKSRYRSILIRAKLRSSP